MDELRAAIASEDEHELQTDQVDDASRSVLNWIYDLWEALMRSRFSSSQKVTDEDLVGDDDAGKTCAAIIFARGEYVHGRHEVGPQSWGYGDGPYGHGPYGGGWMWPAWEQKNTKWALRTSWYEAFVQQQTLVAPLEQAISWLRGQPELSA